MLCYHLLNQTTPESYSPDPFFIHIGQLFASLSRLVAVRGGDSAVVSIQKGVLNAVTDRLIILSHKSSSSDELDQNLTHLPTDIVS